MPRIKRHKNVERAFKKKMQDKLLIAASVFVDQAKELAAFDTGQLESSIGIIDKGKNFIRVGTVLNYAKYLEFGTYKMAAQPFVIPSFYITKKKLKAIFKHGQRN